MCGLKSISIFMIVLIVSLPFYISNAMASGDIAEVIVKGQSSSNVQRENNVLAPGDVVKITTEAKVTPGPITKDYLEIFFLSTVPFSYGSGPCSLSSKNPGFYSCEYDSLPLPNTIPQGPYSGSVDLYNVPANVGHSNFNHLKSKNYNFYIDTSAPDAKFLADNPTPTPSIPPFRIDNNDNAVVEVSAGDLGPNSHCAGLKTITVKYENPSGTKYLFATKEYGPEFSGCNVLTEPANYTFIAPMSQIRNDLGNEFMGTLKFCISATDKLDQLIVTPVCKSKDTDLKAPIFMPGEKSITDESGNPLDASSFVTTGMKIIVKANVTEENLNGVWLNESFYNLGTGIAAGVTESNIGGVENKTQITWTITVGTGDLTSDLKANAKDIQGNIASSVLFSASVLPKTIDDVKPALISIEDSSDLGTTRTKYAKADSNYIIAKIKEADSGLEKSAVSLISTAITGTPSADSCNSIGSGMFECVWENIAISGTGPSSVSFTLGGNDRVGNIMNNTVCTNTPDACKLILDTTKPSVSSIIINGESDLRVGSSIEMSMDITEADSGILDSASSYRVYANNSNCGFNYKKAGNCIDNSNDIFTCSWSGSNVGTVNNVDCFKGGINISVYDVAGNSIFLNKPVAPTWAPLIEEANTNTGWFSGYNNKFTVKIDALLITKENVVATSNLFDDLQDKQADECHIDSGKWICTWDNIKLKSSSGNDGTPGAVTFKVKNDGFGRQSDSKDITLQIDKTAPEPTKPSSGEPAIKIIPIDAGDRDIPQVDESVSIIAYANEKFSGINPDNTYFDLKDIDQTVRSKKYSVSDAVSDGCTSCGCSEDVSSGLQKCVWEYNGGYNPRVTGSNAITKLNISFADKANNVKDTPVGLRGNITVFGKGSSGGGIFWTPAIDDDYKNNKNINKNLLKSTNVPINGYLLSIPMHLTTTSENNGIEVQQLTAHDCIISYDKTNKINVDNNRQYYLDPLEGMGAKTHKYFQLKIPAPPKDEWLNNNDKITFNCTVMISNSKGGILYSELETHQMIFDVKIGGDILSTPGTKNIDKAADYEKSLDFARNWFIKPSEAIMSWVPDACIWMSRTMMVASTAALIADGACLTFAVATPAATIACQAKVFNIWHSVWSFWNRDSIFDVVSGEFLCDTVACTGTYGIGNVLSGALGSAISVPVKNIASAMPTNPKDNLILSVARIPPCFTGIYKTGKEWEMTMLAENWCHRKSMLLPGVNCGELVQSFWCRQTAGVFTGVIATVVGSILLNLIKGWLGEEILKTVMKSFACTEEFVPGDQYLCYGMGITSGTNYLVNSVEARDIYNRYNDQTKINDATSQANDEWDNILREGS